MLFVFSRNTNTGVLTQLAGKAGCLSRNGGSEDGPNTCTHARDLDTGDAKSITISSDGRFVYVALQFETKSDDAVGGFGVQPQPQVRGAARLAGLAAA